MRNNLETTKAPPRCANSRGLDTGNEVPMYSNHSREVCWAAGFLEGEGSFIANNRGYLMVVCAQKQREPLERLIAIFGGRIYRAPRTRIYTWHVSGKKAKEIMELLDPLMSPRRRWQIHKSIQAADKAEKLRPGTGAHQKGKTRCPRGHKYDAIRKNKDGTFRGRVCTVCHNEKRRERYASDLQYREKAKKAAARQREKSR